jgi:hypothetical protein
MKKHFNKENIQKIHGLHNFLWTGEVKNHDFDVCVLDGQPSTQLSPHDNRPYL